MAVHVKKEYRPRIDKLLQLIEETRSATGARASFDGLKLLGYGSILFGALYFSIPIPSSEARRIVTDAIFKAAHDGVISREAFLKEANRLEREYHARPEQRFVLASSISIVRTAKIPRIRLGNTVIILEPELPTRFESESAKLRKKAKFAFSSIQPIDYMFVRVHVTAKGFAEAAHMALNELDFIRSIWNFVLNYGRWTFHVGGTDRPLNAIVLGPIHSLHLPSGKLATDDQWWYQSEYSGPVRPFFDTVQLSQLSDLTKKIRKLVQNHSYQDLITEALLRYTRALDEPRAEIAFRKLWSVFELLTHGTKDRIESATYLLRDFEYHRFVLKQLKGHRNDLVHADKHNAEMKTYLLHLKSYIDRLLKFHLENQYGFGSMSEATTFLSQPRDLDALRKRRRFAQIALERFGRFDED